MEQFRAKSGYICDMDGVIYHGNRLLPGVKEFVAWLYRENKQFLFLTNSSSKTPRELQDKLARMGLDVDEKHFYLPRRNSFPASSPARRRMSSAIRASITLFTTKGSHSAT